MQVIYKMYKDFLYENIHLNLCLGHEHHNITELILKLCENRSTIFLF